MGVKNCPMQSIIIIVISGIIAVRVQCAPPCVRSHIVLQWVQVVCLTRIRAQTTIAEHTKQFNVSHELNM